MKKKWICLCALLVTILITMPNPIQAEEPQVGWVEKNDHWYWYNEDGSYATGWLEDNDRLYYLFEDGTMAVGWQTIDGATYYFWGGGSCAADWSLIDNLWYHFNEDRQLETGWLDLPEGRYYCEEDGSMRTGWMYHQGHWLYFRPNGKQAYDESVEIKYQNFTFDQNGYWIQGDTQ